MYNLSAQTVAIGDDINFDTNGVITPGIPHVAGSEEIIVITPGDYKITFTVSTNEPSQFALFRNDVLMEGTLYGSGSGAQGNIGQFIVTLAAGDILTIRNNISFSDVTLQTMAGGTQTNANASVILKKLN
ncbi:collagen-like protein [Peribacillus sp. NPDC097295]|uniref:BclA C-terminal domain-containing protein n=1 Tax=Peribacillus sp. NPDC097295 TaxID=3364402 RepID=UPI003830721A